jgi:hypothetical protein
MMMSKSVYIWAASQWDMLNEMAKQMQVRLLFDLNGAVHNIDGAWNATNARQLLEYSQSKGYDNIDFELGNGITAYTRRRVFLFRAGWLGCVGRT